RRIQPVAPPNDTVAGLPPSLSPAAPIHADVVSFATNTISQPKPFGLGPRLFRWIPQPSLDADGASAAVALVSRDVIGRSEVIANFAFGDAAAWRGAAVSASWRGTRPALRFLGFGADQTLSRSRAPVPRVASFDVPLDVRMTGIEASVDGTEQFDVRALRYRVGASAGRVEAATRSVVGTTRSGATRTFIFGDGAAAWTQ